jgi:acyl carrier protein
LKTDNVSIDDDFFENGGDSLLAMELHLEIQQLIGQTLSESLLFELATVRELAKRLSARGACASNGRRPESSAPECLRRFRQMAGNGPLIPDTPPPSPHRSDAQGL